MVKQEVLAALDAARGRYISGQELAAQLGVSRTAVWKAVAALRRDGIPIEAVTNRGYTLAQSVDVLNAAAVAVQLDEATVKALQIEVVDRLPGTNAALRSRADAGIRHSPDSAATKPRAVWISRTSCTSAGRMPRSLSKLSTWSAKLGRGSLG